MKGICYINTILKNHNYYNIMFVILQYNIKYNSLSYKRLTKQKAP